MNAEQLAACREAFLVYYGINPAIHTALPDEDWVEAFKAALTYRQPEIDALKAEMEKVAASATMQAAENGILRAKTEELTRQVEEAKKDTERLEFLYTKHFTASNALVQIELDILNDKYPTMEHVRASVDDAIAQQGEKP